MASGYWSETRLNGAPLEPGTVCWVTEVPGQNPIATYGKSAQEVIEKLSLNQAHASAALARRSAEAATPNGSAPVVTPVTPARRRLTADEVFQYTEDLKNPAKAAEASMALVEDASGIDLRKIALQTYAAMAMNWQKANPDFYDHPGNKRLLTDQAKALVGGDLTMVTAEVLTQAYTILRNRGELMSAPVAMPPNPNAAPTPASSTDKTIPFPGESPVQRTERPRGAPFATQTRSTSFRGGQATPSKTPKFTELEIRRMPEAKMRELNDPKHPDHAAYNECCELYFGQAARA